jgi:hypothetical protein
MEGISESQYQLKNIFACIWVMECLEPFHENIDKAITESDAARTSLELWIGKEVSVTHLTVPNVRCANKLTT